MIYLASPYSHPSPSMRQHRYELVREAVGLLWKQKVKVFSPIIYTHEIAKELNIPYEAAYWESFNDDMQDFCDEMYILNMLGWRESVGVHREICRWLDHEKSPIQILTVFKHDIQLKPLQ